MSHSLVYIHFPFRFKLSFQLCVPLTKNFRNLLVASYIDVTWCVATHNWALMYTGGMHCRKHTTMQNLTHDHEHCQWSTIRANLGTFCRCCWISRASTAPHCNNALQKRKRFEYHTYSRMYSNTGASTHISPATTSVIQNICFSWGAFFVDRFVHFLQSAVCSRSWVYLFTAMLTTAAW